MPLIDINVIQYKQWLPSFLARITIAQISSKCKSIFERLFIKQFNLTNILIFANTLPKKMAPVQ